MDATHEVAERLVDHPMLANETDALEGRSADADIEVVALARGVLDGNVGTGERRSEPSMEIVDGNHRGRPSGPGHLTQGRAAASLGLAVERGSRLRVERARPVRVGMIGAQPE